MTKYEYDTLIVDRNNVDKFDAELKQRVEEGFEVFNTQMAVSGSSIHLAYFLRKEIVPHIENYHLVTAASKTALQKYSNEVQHTEDGSGDGAQGDVDYERALVNFHSKTREILGLK